MEGADTPEQVAPALTALRAEQDHLEDALVPIMTGLIQSTGWMRAE